MNATLKNVLIFVGGAVVGTLTGVLATRSYFSKRSQKLVDEIRDYYQGELNKHVDSVFSEVVLPDDKAEELRQVNAEIKKIKYVPPEPVAYHKIKPPCQRPMSKTETLDEALRKEFARDVPQDEPRYNEEEYNPDEDMHPEDFDDEPVIPEIKEDYGDDPPPYVITEEEYLWSKGIYEKDCLTYYILDGTLADDNDDTYEHDLVGEENLKLFEEEGVDVIYVRNVECGMEWEICKVDRSFTERKHAELEHPREDDD